MQKLYDYETWFRRKVKVLRKGVDYHCANSSMMQQVRQAALAFGVSLKITGSPEGITVNIMNPLPDPAKNGSDKRKRTNPRD